MKFMMNVIYTINMVKNREPLLEQDARSIEERLGAEPLRAGVQRISRAASIAGRATPSTLASAVDEVQAFLVQRAIPRFEAEHEVLYPVIERAIGRPGVTAPLDVEHAAVRAQTERLESLAQRLGRPPIGRSERRAVESILSDLNRLLLDHLEREARLCTQASAAEPELGAGWEALATALEEAERRALGAVVLVVRPAVGSQAATVMRHNPVANLAHPVTLADLAQNG
jgi:hypothetical protein